MSNNNISNIETICYKNENDNDNSHYSETLFQNNNMGIIITRHVYNVKTNCYWNLSVQTIRKYYPSIPIVIIDDNSNLDYVKEFNNYTNIKIIHSEFKGRGELLPYLYLLKYRFFNNALIMHDSVFIHRRINFDNIIKKGTKVLPLWYFYPDKENLTNRIKIASSLNNFWLLKNDLELTDTLMFQIDKWYGCFGVQCFINLNFLFHIESKYRITNLINSIKCRSDRQCLERIMGCIFSKEFNVKGKYGSGNSLLGNIMTYQRFGYSFEEYIHDLKHNNIKKPVVKVWTGR